MTQPASEDNAFYFVREKDSDIYDRLSKTEITKRIACGEIEERQVSGWVMGPSGRLIFSNNVKEYVKKKKF